MTMKKEFASYCEEEETILDVEYSALLLTKSFKTYCLKVSQKLFLYRESAAGSVIQATGTLEFENGLRT